MSMFRRLTLAQRLAALAGIVAAGASIAGFVPGFYRDSHALVTAGHIHLGAKGENGPIVVTLFKYDSPMNEVSKMAQLRLINSKDQ